MRGLQDTALAADVTAVIQAALSMVEAGHGAAGGGDENGDGDEGEGAGGGGAWKRWNRAQMMEVRAGARNAPLIQSSVQHLLLGV